MNKWDELRQQIRWRIGYVEVLAAAAFEAEDWEAYAGQRGRLAEIESILVIMDGLEANTVIDEKAWKHLREFSGSGIGEWDEWKGETLDV